MIPTGMAALDLHQSVVGIDAWKSASLGYRSPGDFFDVGGEVYRGSPRDVAPHREYVHGGPGGQELLCVIGVDNPSGRYPSCSPSTLSIARPPPTLVGGLGTKGAQDVQPDVARGGLFPPPPRPLFFLPLPLPPLFF